MTLVGSKTNRRDANTSISNRATIETDSFLLPKTVSRLCCRLQTTLWNRMTEHASLPPIHRTNLSLSLSLSEGCASTWKIRQKVFSQFPSNLKPGSMMRLDEFGEYLASESRSNNKVLLTLTLSLGNSLYLHVCTSDQFKYSARNFPATSMSLLPPILVTPSTNLT